MSRHEDPRLARFHEVSTAVGEIASVTADSVTISGAFSPGLGTYELRPGARVFVFNEDDAVTFTPHSQGCDL